MIDDDDDFWGGVEEVPLKKGYIPAESRSPTADESNPPSGGSSVIPPVNQTEDD